MSNKLTPVIIDNACRRGWQYRARDSVMALITLALWLMVLSRLHAFYAVEDALMEQLVDSVMLKILLMGFGVTFLTFHVWAMYNRHLYVSMLKSLAIETPVLEHQAPFEREQFGLAQRIEVPAPPKRQ